MASIPEENTYIGDGIAYAYANVPHGVKAYC